MKFNRLWFRLFFQHYKIARSYTNPYHAVHIGYLFACSFFEDGRRL